MDGVIIAPDGVTTAIVGFIFVCIIFPSLIKNRHQYYMALAAVVIGILLQSVATLVGNKDLYRVMGSIAGLLNALAILVLVMAAGGLSPRQLAADMARAYQVMRRGENEVTTIIPREGQTARRPAKAAGDEDDEDGRTTWVINEPPPAPKKKDEGSIPLD